MSEICASEKLWGNGFQRGEDINYFCDAALYQYDAFEITVAQFDKKYINAASIRRAQKPHCILHLNPLWFESCAAFRGAE